MPAEAGPRRLVRRAEHVVVPWRNGRGTTTELAVEPPGATFDRGLRWRLSAAAVTEDGPFSRFAGLTRTLVLLDGPVLELEVDGQVVRLDRPFALARFPGGATTGGRVPEGPVRDLNWMVADGLAHAAEVCRGGGHLPEVPGREWLVVPLDAEIVVNGEPLAPLEVWVGAGGAWAGAGAAFVGWIGVQPEGTVEHSGDT
jgi:environmental stress-induced protein Ves